MSAPSDTRGAIERRLAPTLARLTPAQRSEIARALLAVYWAGVSDTLRADPPAEIQHAINTR